MHLLRVTIPAAFALVTALVLGGCGILEPTPVPTLTTTASPSPTAIDTTKYIGGVIDPSNSVWFGKDSGGDATTLTLHADGTVAVTYGSNAYDYPGDTWSVVDGILHVEVYLDATNGSAEYVGTWNPKKSVVDAVLTTTLSDKKLTVTLTQQ
ncbi:MAG: hypothetical protein KF801_03540 [Cryobacterium sp.]|nr:hypothetical protein [Cryobacterium sp.]